MMKTATDDTAGHWAFALVRREFSESVVMISLEDYEVLEETAYLLRSPANARRLVSALESLAKGKAEAKKMNLEA